MATKTWTQVCSQPTPIPLRQPLQPSAAPVTPSKPRRRQRALDMLGYFILVGMSGSILAEFLSTPTPSFWQLGSNLGAVGIVAWLVWYQNSKTIPTMQRAHGEALHCIAEGHAKAMEETVAAFKEEIQNERDQCIKLHRDGMERFDKMIDRMAENQRDVLAEIRMVGLTMKERKPHE